MTVYDLRTEQFLPISLEDAWDFFSTPINLDAITPPELKFRILSDVSGKMYPGQIIQYRIQAIPGIWQSWLTEITHVVEREYFIDEQRFGPYKFWHHRHSFESVSGGVMMRDHIHYALPLGPLGAIVNAVYVGRQVRHIFNYRHQILEKRFPLDNGSKKAGNQADIMLTSPK